MALMRRAKPIDVVEARRLYEQTNLPVDHIAAMHGVGRTALYKRIHLWGWQMRRPTLALTDPPRGPDERQPANDREREAVLSDVAAIATRIRRAIESELDAVEKTIRHLSPGDGGDEAERAARVLASLARTLQEVARLDPKGVVGTQAKEDDDRGPADPDEFIRELARRMDEFARGASAPVPDGATAAMA